MADVTETGTPAVPDEGSQPLPRIRASRDVMPDADDIDRGAIGSVGNTQRANIMKGGAFAAVAAVVGIFFITHGNAGHKSDQQTASEKQAQATPAKSVVDYDTVAAKPAPTLAAAAADPNAPVISPGATGKPAMVLGPNGQLVPAIQPGTTPTEPKNTPAQVMADSARRSPLMAFGAGSGSQAMAASQPGEETQTAGAVQPVALQGSPSAVAAAKEDEPQGPNELDRLRRQSAVTESRAKMIGNRDYLITAGTVIPCVLQTALNSSQPGYVTCVIPKDIYSDNGRVILMEKGTKVLGEYRGGLNNGENRLFALWTRAETPRGVSIDLASPGSDALGRAGFAGGVDTFFWARFGGAIMLSLIDDTMQVAGQALQNRGTNTTQVPGQTAGIALQNTINIRPVLKKNQGEEVAIFVAQDFNFADVYGLEIKR